MSITPLECRRNKVPQPALCSPPNQRQLRTCIGIRELHLQRVP